MLKRINFVKPSNTSNGYGLLVHCVICGFGYPQASEELAAIGYYVPKDLYIEFTKVIDISIDLDIGNRQKETV